MSYDTEYRSSFLQDPVRIERFITTGEDGRRIFSVLNTNIKTMQTYVEYINTMYMQTTNNVDLRAKTETVRAGNFRSLKNHTDLRAITRSDIVLAARGKFGYSDHAFVIFLLYILLLDVGNNVSEVVENAKGFLDELPKFIRRRLFEYARQIALAERKPFPNDNVYLEAVVLYGDEILFSEFIQHIKNNYPNEQAITNLFVSEAAINTSPISKRIGNYQPSALKKDALYTIIFYALDQYVRKCKMKGFRTGKKLFDAEFFLLDFLDYFNDVFDGSLTWLGKLSPGEDIDTLKVFISSGLSASQKEELYTCIQNAFGLHIPIP